MPSRRGCLRAALIAGAVLVAAGVQAQTPETGQDKATDGQQPKAPVVTATPPAPVKAPIERWVDMQTANFQMRYRRIETTAGAVTSNHLQDNIALKARFKFDEKAKYTVNAFVNTGSSFTGSWNNTGAGTGDRQLAMYLKQLYAAAAPIKGVEGTFGSLGVVRGESTEITSYDNDGYVLGERISVKRPKQLYFDEISVTTAWLGGTATPGLSDRYTHIDEWNYYHFLVDKRLSKRLAVSADYTRLSGVGTMRAAFNLKTPELVVLDSVRWEQYGRYGTKGEFGYSGYGEKAVTKRVAVGGGYADIDANYGGLNADRFQRGRRLFETATVKITRDLTTSLFITQAINNPMSVTNKHRFDWVVSYNAMGPIQRAGLFR